MAWNEVLDQQHARMVLQRAIESDRVAHAYLFYGPDGVGKRAVALEFARALLCEQNRPNRENALFGPTDAGKVGEACGRCTSCSKVKRLIHPDVHVLIPAPTDTDAEQIGRRVALLADSPYAAIDFTRRPDGEKSANKQSAYYIERFREDLRHATAFNPVEGEYKVVIITDADLMRTESANAFLKILEEPPARTVLILTTRRVDRLLPTVLSRCQRLSFDLLTPDAIAGGLQARGIEAALAVTLSRMADGSFSRAIELAENENLAEDRNRVVAFLRMAYAVAQRPEDLIKTVDTLAGMSRERSRDFLRLTLTWIRDLVLYQTGGPEAQLVNLDQAEIIARFCNNLAVADLPAMASLAEEAILLIERNVNQKLLFNALTLALNRALHGRPGGDLYVPLAQAASL